MLVTGLVHVIDLDDARRPALPGREVQRDVLTVAGRRLGHLNPWLGFQFMIDLRAACSIACTLDLDGTLKGLPIKIAYLLRRHRPPRHPGCPPIPCARNRKPARQFSSVPSVPSPAD